jgi:MtN3 and saliva related transmembrane protein
MNITEIIGYIAATVGTIIFIPQAIQTIRTKDTRSLSLPTFILISLNNSLWLTYGLLSLNTPIILSQVLVFPLCLVILGYKIKYG